MHPHNGVASVMSRHAAKMTVLKGGIILVKLLDGVSGGCAEGIQMYGNQHISMPKGLKERA